MPNKKKKNKSLVRYRDLPGIKAKETSTKCFKIYTTKSNNYVAFYSDYHKAMFIVDDKFPELQDCSNLKQAMRFAFLKIQKPIS